MAPSSVEDILLTAPQIARTRGPGSKLIAKFALIVATVGLMRGYDLRRRRRRRHDLDLAFQVYLFADFITFILGFLLTFLLTVATPDSTITMWVTLSMSVATLALGSYLLIFDNCNG